MDATPVIIEVALNGMTSTALNLHVPRSAADVAADAIRCIEAGASIVHTHLDGFGAGVEETVRAFTEQWEPVRARFPDALLYPTFRDFPAIADRIAHVPALAESGLARFCYVDSGSTNVGGADDEGLPTGSSVYVNTYDDCRYAFDLCARLGIGPSIAVFEPGFLRVALAYERAGRMPPGAMVKFYFGGEVDLFTGRPTPITFGMPPTIACLDAYLDMARPSRLPWAVAVLGGDCGASEVAAHAVARGGHLRVGLEDHAGARTPTNVELVAEAAAIAHAAGRRPATPAEAADLLGLPGRRTGRAP